MRPATSNIPPVRVCAPLLALALCLGCWLPLAPQAAAMGPRPEELPRFEGDPETTVYEHYSSAENGKLLSYTLVVQFHGCPDQAAFNLELDSDLPVALLPGVEQLARDETCLRISELLRPKDASTLRGQFSGCERGNLTATIPVSCPEGCAEPEIHLEHNCAQAETWIAGQPDIMDSRPGPRNLGWIDGPQHTLVGFRFHDLRPGPFQITFSRDQEADLEVVAVHFLSDPEASHTARVESLGAEENVYSAVVHAPGEFEMLVLLASGDPLERVAGQISPAAPVAPLAMETDYAAAGVPNDAQLDANGLFSFAVDNCAGAWGRRNGLCSHSAAATQALDRGQAISKRALRD